MSARVYVCEYVCFHVTEDTVNSARVFALQNYFDTFNCAEYSVHIFIQKKEIDIEAGKEKN